MAYQHGVSIKTDQEALLKQSSIAIDISQIKRLNRIAVHKAGKESKQER